MNIHPYRVIPQPAIHTSSSLFERITTYSCALRYLNGDKNHVSSYEVVIQLLDPEKATVHKNTNLRLPAVEYLRRVFVDPITSVRKINIVMYIAVLKADDQDNDVLAKEVSDRFQGLGDFDRGAVTKIPNFSICTEPGFSWIRSWF